VAITGADCDCNITKWRAIRIGEGEIIHFSHTNSGLWSYLAVEGGFAAETIFGSRSTYARGHLGRVLSAGDILARNTQHSFSLPAGVAGRAVPWSETRNYAAPPTLRVWPGPQWDFFAAADREQF